MNTPKEGQNENTFTSQPDEEQFQTDADRYEEDKLSALTGGYTRDPSESTDGLK